MGCGAVNASEVGRDKEAVLTLNRIYERKELIGSGSYGKVYRCINKLNGQEYALKVVEITAKTREEAVRQINALKAEIGVLKKLSHENIVKYYSFDISSDSKQVEIVLEYAKRGSLRQYFLERGHLEEREAAAMTAQILKGLKHLHEQNIVHRDLKCANILIMEDGTLKISDFGTAKTIQISSN
jgi:mitogen-activated protein kinase kinase kinase 1